MANAENMSVRNATTFTLVSSLSIAERPVPVRRALEGWLSVVLADGIAGISSDDIAVYAADCSVSVGFWSSADCGVTFCRAFVGDSSTSTRSATARASSMLWVTSSTVTPRRCRSASKPRIRALAVSSRLAVGSSSSSTSG